MNMYYTNINNLNTEIEDFVIAKNKIEIPLIELGKIEKKMSINEFIEYINFDNNVYCIMQEVIPFEIIKPNDKDIVIVYSSTCDKEYNNQFKKDLERIDFDLSNLKHISQLDIINGDIDLTKQNYFIINKEFYK